MPIKDRLKQLRTAAGLTQQTLAVKAELSVSAVVQIEAGKIPDPRVSTLRALAKALGVSLDEMAGEEGESGPQESGAEAAPRKRRSGKKEK